MNIGVIGNGIVGNAVKLGFGQHCNIFVNDKEISKDSPFTKKELVEHCDYIFVGVPTPFNTTTQEVDTSIIEGVINELNLQSEGRDIAPTIIVKSAIVPRLVKSWEYFRNINIVVSPEYLTERNHLHDFVNQKVMILGGNRYVCEALNELYLSHSICNKQCKVAYCTAQEAALIKYMENSFLAMKCIFNNEFKKFYDTHFHPIADPGFNKLLEVFYTDERMGLFPFKYTVPGPDGDLGYGGKCLPKDTQAIIAEAKRQGTPLTLLEKVVSINDEIRTNRDWEAIDGALSN